MTSSQLAALREWANECGKNYKSRLRDAWMSGSYPGVRSATACELHRLRNDPSFGPVGLAKFDAPKGWVEA